MFDGSWSQTYPAEYEAHALAASLRRARRRERERKATKPAAAPTATQAIAIDARRASRASRDALVALRWKRGFVWRGGFLGGSTEYRRPPLTYEGLVSDEAPILKLFVAKTHRAARLLTGDTKSEAIGTDSKLLALDSLYVESNKLLRGVLRAELDTVWPSWNALAAAIRDIGCPLPNVAVGYVDAAGRVWRPHLIWILAESVLFKGGLRAPQASWSNALRGLTAKLLPLGADPGGCSNPHRHKSPVCPLWDRCVMAPEPYALSEDPREGAPGYAVLRPHLPAPQEAIDALARATAEAKNVRPSADHPDPVIAIHSNALFRHLAAFARSRVAGHRDLGHGSKQEFAAEIAMEALVISPGGLKAERISLARAASVTEWTWSNYRIGKPTAPLSDEERTERLAEGARHAGRNKTSTTKTAVIVAIRDLTSAGSHPTREAVAQIVGKSVRTIGRYWAAAKEAATEAGQDISLPIDKKGPAPRSLPDLDPIPPQLHSTQNEVSLSSLCPLQALVENSAEMPASSYSTVSVAPRPTTKVESIAAQKPVEERPSSVQVGCKDSAPPTAAEIRATIDLMTIIARDATGESWQPMEPPSIPFRLLRIPEVRHAVVGAEWACREANRRWRARPPSADSIFEDDSPGSENG